MDSLQSCASKWTTRVNEATPISICAFSQSSGGTPLQHPKAKRLTETCHASFPFSGAEQQSYYSLQPSHSDASPFLNTREQRESNARATLFTRSIRIYLVVVRNRSYYTIRQCKLRSTPASVLRSHPPGRMELQHRRNTCSKHHSPRKDTPGTLSTALRRLRKPINPTSRSFAKSTIKAASHLERQYSQRGDSDPLSTLKSPIETRTDNAHVTHQHRIASRV